MATTESKNCRLLQQAEKILLHPIYAHLIAYCPTMDLIAVVTDEENLDVYRINGQRAFGLKRKSDEDTVDALQWEFNGKSIAVSWSDGSTDLVSAETGKVTHKDVMLPSIATPDDAMGGDTPARVKCMGWGLNFIEVENVKKRTGMAAKKSNGATPDSKDIFGNPTTEDWDAFEDDTSLEDFLQRQPDFHRLDITPDLPDQLAMMDIEVLLPKLPAIPLPPALPFMRAPQAAAGGFGSQAEVDSLLHSHHLKDHNSVDMFIRCSDRGMVHPSIYDSLETVNIHLPTAWNIESTPLLHTSHPYSCSHGLLMSTTSASAPRRQQIAFVPLTLNFIPSAGIYLHLIASKTSQLQNLLLYITQTLQRIRTFFKQSTDLPSKFMMNISETLEEKGQGDLITNLFHLACTGDCSATMHEWLVDELAEQGHKRWDTTVTSSMTTLLALVHENLIPAIDRCSIVISRLRGLAQFHDRDWIFRGPLSDFTVLLETLKNMRLLSHTVLLYASEEKRMFQQFSRWLRFSIDFEATEPGSQSRKEMEDKDSGADVAQVLEYIRYGLTKSDVAPFLKQDDGGKKDAESYEDTKKAIESLKEGGQYKSHALCLETVFVGLKEGVQGLLRQVSRWQESNILMNEGVVLETTTRDVRPSVDMRMVFEPPTNTISTYIAVLLPPSSSSSSSSLTVHCLTHTPSISSLEKDLQLYTLAPFSFPAGTSVLDARFADDTSLLVLLHNTSPQSQSQESTHVILSLPYTPTSTPSSSPLLTYHPAPTPLPLLPSGTSPPRPTHLYTPISRDLLEKHTIHVFGGRFEPLKLVVNGRKGRRVVVVLGKDRKHYRVLDLDFREGDDGKEEGGEEGERDVQMGGS